jgi:hypothetical protein
MANMKTLHPTLNSLPMLERLIAKQNKVTAANRTGKMYWWQIYRIALLPGNAAPHIPR